MDKSARDRFSTDDEAKKYAEVLLSLVSKSSHNHSYIVLKYTNYLPLYQIVLSTKSVSPLWPLKQYIACVPFL